MLIDEFQTNRQIGHKQVYVKIHSIYKNSFNGFCLLLELSFQLSETILFYFSIYLKADYLFTIKSS